ncbi:MAG: hypothetical protein GYA50_02700 [Eubacteriaceae bacterium]|nr:hypothetical protein [Eubacteriaceae bacterium]
MKNKKIVLVLLVAIIMIMFAACGGGGAAKTPTLTDAHMTTELNDNGNPADTVDTYAATAEQFIITGQLKNAPQTDCTFVWKKDGKEITKTTMKSGSMSPQLIYSMIENKGTGSYSVDILIGTATTPAATINFTVK